MGEEPGIDGLSALIVEDEAIPSLLLGRFLRQLGFLKVDRESTGRGALRRVAEQRYDMVFMDIGLGDDIDGIEVATVIRESQDTRLFFMTGYSDAEMERRARRLDPEEYFIKPLDLDLIRQAIFEPSRRSPDEI